ncbi:hypothetical protein GC209_19035 [bacterium]|nr:hypothetical protein [bacterium]
MARQTNSSMTLSRAFFGFMALMTLVGAVALALSLQRITGQLTQRMLFTAIEGRSQAAVDTFQRDLAQDWRLLTAVTAIAPRQPGTTLRPALELAASIADRDETSWIGFAGLDGKVIAATGGLLEGEDVSQRPWFKNGLSKPYAGDVHDATLLAKLLSPDSAEPVRFIDYARPVRSTTGDVIGVMGMHISFDWAARRLKEIGAPLSLDLFLVSQDGAVIISTADTDPVHPVMQAFQLAKLGAKGSVLAPWPDGKSYFSMVRPVQAAQGVPSFGWRLIARIDANALGDISGDLARSIAKIIAALALILIVMTIWFAKAIAQPFSRLASMATAIAEGKDIFPREYSRLTELRQISGALARLQARGAGSAPPDRD